MTLHQKHRALLCAQPVGVIGCPVQRADNSVSECSKMGSASLIGILVPAFDPKEGPLKLLVHRLPSSRPDGCDTDHRPSVCDVTRQVLPSIFSGQENDD